MRVIYSQSVSELCQCERTLANSEATLLTHLWFLSSLPADDDYAFDVCPRTGILWLLGHSAGSHSSGALSDSLVHTRLKHRLPVLTQRTVAVGVLRVATHPRQRLYPPETAQQLPTPTFPLQGLLYCCLMEHTHWKWRTPDGDLQERGYLSLGVWLSVPVPLDRGEQGEVYVASPLEAITVGGLAVGREFKVWYHSGVLGRLEVVGHRVCSAEEFAQVFSFDRAVKLV